jgi:hypothetical protein
VGAPRGKTTFAELAQRYEVHPDATSARNRQMWEHAVHAFPRGRLCVGSWISGIRRNPEAP